MRAFPLIRGHTRAALSALALAIPGPAAAARIPIPMDQAQINHLKAYGVAHHSLTLGAKVEWLLNHRGGAFLLEDTDALHREAARRGLLFENADAGEVSRLRGVIETSDMEAVVPEKATKMAVYTLPTTLPWDDA